MLFFADIRSKHNGSAQVPGPGLLPGLILFQDVPDRFPADVMAHAAESREDAFNIHATLPAECPNLVLDLLRREL
ncbi:hypothetical protein [Actinomadura geliboluensis]|uniref:hypothetical protein n=1 Tax=Actinomadura geliboluensis TaxID=882440 RepID=UPI0037232622